MFSSERSSEALYPSRSNFAAACACSLFSCQHPVPGQIAVSVSGLQQQKPMNVERLTSGWDTTVRPCHVDATVIRAAPLGIFTRTASDRCGSRSRGHLCDPGTTMALVNFSVRETP